MCGLKALRLIQKGQDDMENALEFMFAQKENPPSGHTLQGTITYPIPSRYFWVDDFPNLPFGGIWYFPRGWHFWRLLWQEVTVSYISERDLLLPIPQRLQDQDDWSPI